ncbi:MAG: CarD family transcriptional regulator [Pseudomonadota bacterium]
MGISFKVGDNVVCPSYGVGEVRAIEKKDIGGAPKPFYIIHIYETSLKFMIPAEGVSSAGVRNLVDLKEVRGIYKILRTKIPMIKNDRGKWKKRCRRYMDMIKTGAAYQVAEVLRDLLSMSNHKELSFAERKILESARGMLVKELALASEKTEIEVNKKIDRIFFIRRVN